MMRNVGLEHPRYLDWSCRTLSVDYLVRAVASFYGDTYVIDRDMAVHRKHPGGLSQSALYRDRVRLAESTRNLYLGIRDLSPPDRPRVRQPQAGRCQRASWRSPSWPIAGSATPSAMPRRRSRSPSRRRVNWSANDIGGGTRSVETIRRRRLDQPGTTSGSIDFSPTVPATNGERVVGDVLAVRPSHVGPRHVGARRGGRTGSCRRSGD